MLVHAMYSYLELSAMERKPGLRRTGFCCLKLVTSPQGILLFLVEPGSLRLSGKQAVKRPVKISFEKNGESLGSDIPGDHCTITRG